MADFLHYRQVSKPIASALRLYNALCNIQGLHIIMSIPLSFISSLPAPAEGSSLPQPRAYGLPASPSVRRASTFVRTNPTLPSVPEPNASLSPGVSSASPRHAMMTSPLPVSPESARPVRHSIYGVTLRPVGQSSTSGSVTSPPGNLQRNRTLPPRPLPGRRDSVPVRSHTFQAAASGKHIFPYSCRTPFNFSLLSIRARNFVATFEAPDVFTRSVPCSSTTPTAYDPLCR